MNLARAKSLAASLQGYVGGSVLETSVEIEVIDKGDNSAIKIKPALENTSGSLFHCMEVTDFCRGNHLDFGLEQRSHVDALSPSSIFSNNIKSK